MIKKAFYSMIAALMLLFSSCENYDREIADIIDRLDQIEGTSIATINQQIAAINGSIDDLKGVDAELKGYIESLQTTANNLQSQIDATNTALAALESDLEGQISASEQKVLNELNAVKTALEDQLATINNTIAALKAKDAELEQRYFDLEQYINDEIAYTEEWASFTFSTLEQYEETQTAISEINALIKSTQESITALEEKLNKKIADDIATAIAGVDADIAAKVTEITDGYTAAIATTKEDITAAYTDAIKTAITASETSMKEWVNSVLADGYYQKAEIDGKITALQTQVADGDAALQKEIDDLEAALAKAESDLTAAYEKAIDAITENNGQISAEIAAAVATAQDNLQAQIDAITGEIEKIKTRLDIIEADIASINQQIAAINASLEDLKKVDAELKGYIESLQTTANNLQSQIDATNTALAALESDLEGQITASEQKVLNELNAVKTALEDQLATINNTIAALKAKDAELEQRYFDLEQYINDEIAYTEEWASFTFATLEQYEETQTAISEINALIKSTQESITALEEKLSKKITDDIAAAVAGVNADIAAKVTEITDAYTAAIATAKEDITAAYTDAIKTAIAASEASMKEWVNGELQKVYSDISALRIELEALAASAATDEELTAAVTAQQAALEQAKKDLTAAYEAAIKKAIEDNNGVIDDAIAAAITAATNNLQNEIANIKSEIDSIKNRLKALEENFANRIQSLKYIPQFSDGKIALSFSSRSTELYLRISPASIAGLIGEEHVTVLARETDNPSTRALNAEFPLHITELLCDAETGIIHVKFAEDETLGTFSNKFWMGSNEAVVCVRISDGNNDVFSDMVPMISKDFLVDLGLPSGTLWAACNVGATRSEGYGDYFAWGETSPKTTYTWDSYKWGTENNLTKYNSTDDKTTLEEDDDAATVNMGADWSTPTDEQWRELISQCVWTWTTLNGVNGYNIAGDNGNSIFLPAAGAIANSSKIYDNSDGLYWCNNLTNIGKSLAYFLGSSSNNRLVSDQGNPRFCGSSVRAVKK